MKRVTISIFQQSHVQCSPTYTSITKGEGRQVHQKAYIFLMLISEEQQPDVSGLVQTFTCQKQQ